MRAMIQANDTWVHTHGRHMCVCCAHPLAALAAFRPTHPSAVCLAPPTPTAHHHHHTSRPRLPRCRTVPLTPSPPTPAASNTTNNVPARFAPIQASLPYPFDALEPAIDNETMYLHFSRHHVAYINAANGVLGRYPALRGLPLSTVVRCGAASGRRTAVQGTLLCLPAMRGTRHAHTLEFAVSHAYVPHHHQHRKRVARTHMHMYTHTRTHALHTRTHARARTHTHTHARSNAPTVQYAYTLSYGTVYTHPLRATVLRSRVGTKNFTAEYGLPASQTTILRNNAGGHWRVCGPAWSRPAP